MSVKRHKGCGKHVANAGSFKPGDKRICRDVDKLQAGRDKRTAWAIELEKQFDKIVPDGDGKALERLAANFVQGLLCVSEEVANGQGNMATVGLLNALADKVLPYMFGKPQAITLTDAEGNAVVPLYINLGQSLEGAGK